MSSCLFFGLMDATMSHEESWHFGRMGQLLERADKTSRILDIKYFILLPSLDYIGTPFDNILWSALLHSVSAFEMYRKKWRRIDHQIGSELSHIETRLPTGNFPLHHASDPNHCMPYQAPRKAPFRTMPRKTIGKSSIKPRLYHCRGYPSYGFA